MGLQTAAVLYPVNSTTLYSDTGIDIRLLDSAEAGATDVTQTVFATHTQDNQGRVFDPGSSNNTNRSILTLQEEGWALRLTDDMTPSDDTNCNAYLPAGTLTLNLRVTITQSGGTYSGGSYAPNWAVALWRYNPSSHTSTGILLGTSNTTSWTLGIGNDLGTYKIVSISAPLASPVEFQPGEILLMEVGVGMSTIPNPTLGTATFTYIYSVDDPNSNITWASGQSIHQVCYIGATSSGSGASSGVIGTILGTTGDSDGVGASQGVLGATAGMVGDAAGTSTASGELSAIAAFAGVSSGEAVVDGVFGAFGSFSGQSSGLATLEGILGAFAGLQGLSEGSSEAAGVLGGDAGMVGTSAGTSEANGAVSSVSGTVGVASGDSDADALMSIILGTVGTVDIGAGGSGDTIIRPVFLFDD
jgi:hypothetical protein